MMALTLPARLKGYRFPRSVIAYAVWSYYRFNLSLRDVEDLLAGFVTEIRPSSDGEF